MDANEVLRRYAAGERDFRELDLRGISLIKANLSGATLNETIWTGTLVEQCKLGTGIGLTDEQRTNLKVRGARLNDLGHGK